MSRPIQLRRKLQLESLELRRMLDGTVTVRVDGGNLFLEGDDKSNFVAVSGTGTPGQYAITGGVDPTSGNPTNIRYRGTNHNEVIVDGVKNSLFVNLHGGNDGFGLTRASFKYDGIINMEGGNDAVGIGQIPASFVQPNPTAPASVQPLQVVLSGAVAFGGSLIVDLGSGNDSILENQLLVKGVENLDAGSGDDQVAFTKANGATGGTVGDTTGVIVNHDLNIHLGRGSDTAELYAVTAGGTLNIDGGGGSKTVEVSLASVRYNANLNLGSGAATVSIGLNESNRGTAVGPRVTIGGDLNVNTGNSNDTIEEASLLVRGTHNINTADGRDQIFLGDDPHDNNVDDTAPTGQFRVTVQHDMNVHYGRGTDTFVADDLIVHGSFVLTHGPDGLNAELEHATIDRDLIIISGSGNDRVELETVHANFLLIDTGAGNDSVIIHQGSSATRAQVFLGDGNDDLSVNDTTVVKEALADGGSGTNTLSGGGNSFGKLTARHFS